MSRSFILNFIILLLVGASCKSKQKILEEVVLPARLDSVEIDTIKPELPEPELPRVEIEPESAYVVTSIQKQPCFGKCPVFEARVYSDGKVVYNGIRFVERMGIHEAYLSEAELQKIIDKALEIEFFELAMAYPINGERIVDFPSTVTYFKYQDQEHKVLNNHNAPNQLIEYENYLIDFLNNLTWIH